MQFHCDLWSALSFLSERGHSDPAYKMPSAGAWLNISTTMADSSLLCKHARDCPEIMDKYHHQLQVTDEATGQTVHTFRAKTEERVYELGVHFSDTHAVSYLPCTTLY